jgi:hypothetical protein
LQSRLSASSKFTLTVPSQRLFACGCLPDLDTPIGW